MDWGCDHDTGFHMKLLVEAAHGRHRHCPTCRANAYGPPYSDFGDPCEDWKERQRKSNQAPDTSALSSVGTDWSQPRAIPWLHPDHPNYYVTSQREAIRVCKDLGIDPERGGFISEKHRQRADMAAKANRREAFSKLSARDRAYVAQARRRSAGRP